MSEKVKDGRLGRGELTSVESQPMGSLAAALAKLDLVVVVVFMYLFVCVHF